MESIKVTKGKVKQIVLIKWFINLVKENETLIMSNIWNTRYDSNNNTRKKITVIGDSMVKFLRSDEMSSVNNAVNVMKHPGSTTDDMVDYVRPVTRKKPDVIIMHVGTNDLTKGVNTMSKVRKIVSAIQEVDSTRNIKLGFFNIVQRADKDYSKEIKDINTRLKSK